MAFEITTHSTLTIPTLVVDTAAYSIGDCMGGKLTLTGTLRKPGGSSTLTDVVVIEEGGTKPTFNITFFSSDPTAGTYTDNAATALSTDTTKIIGNVTVFATDYTTVGGVSIATIQTGNIVLPGNLSLNTTTSLYAVITATAANDLVATNDLILKLGIIQD